MSWADHAKAALARGETVTVRPHGNSMRPKINDGDQVVIEPVGDRVLRRGDIVLVTVRRNDYLHLITAIKSGLYQISNNKGHVNGWAAPSHIHGIVVSVGS